MFKFSLLFTLTAGLSVAQTAVDLASEPVNRVAKKLACNCGCAQDMACQMEPGCGICKRAKMKIFADQQAGKSDSQILDQFVAENGPSVLFVTPGVFGTTAPYVALSMGAIVVLFVIRGLMKKPQAAAVPDIDPEILARINKDMAKLD